ncbi:MAG: hypothetical protein IPJ41_17890 [Phycisphaerales bacterium]|nr:hypothetical protein [Phycisphaerales bacterium]
MSIVVEIILAERVVSADLPWFARAAIAFVFGLLLSFSLNATLNFRVPHKYMMRTFALSRRSRPLLPAQRGRHRPDQAVGPAGSNDTAYAVLRLGSAGVLFAMSYSLHRRYTFRTAKNYGMAVYAAETEDVAEIHRRVGPHLDHLHIDLVDQTRRSDAPRVDLAKIDDARACWPHVPVCIHLMTKCPRRWAGQVWSKVDWLIADVDSEDDLDDFFWECRLRGKRVGVAWRLGTAGADLARWLPHVDFVLVLGIAEPGRSDRHSIPRRECVACVLDDLRSRYGFDLIFDGGVTTQNVREIPAKYIVAASAVLNAADPVMATYRMMTGSHYERDGAV